MTRWDQPGPRQTDKSALRVLVLTSRTGGGHDARAEAFRAWTERLYGATVEVRVEHALENAGPWFARGVAFYNAIQRHAPWFHHLYYNLGEVFGALQGHRLRTGLSYYDALLEEFRPEVILSLHSMLNRGHFAHARQRLGATITCVTYCGEFSGGYGFSRHWVAPDVDLYLGRTEEAVRAARDLGLPAEKGACLGQLLKPAFYEPPMDDRQKRDYLRHDLGLEPDCFTLLLATGGAAAQNHAALLRRLRPLADRLQVIALCGHRVPARRRLEAWRQAYPGFRLKILPFSDEMDRLLQVASAVVTRPGTTTCAEALNLGCPILFVRSGGTMPQERCTLRYFGDLGLAADFRAPAQLAGIVGTWLERPLDYQRYRQRFLAFRPRDEPEAVIRAILGRPQDESAGLRQGDQAP
jgi:processive 1,2-diacylglycerol beta-glucosyltransferase